MAMTKTERGRYLLNTTTGAMFPYTEVLVGEPMIVECDGQGQVLDLSSVPEAERRPFNMQLKDAEDDGPVEKISDYLKNISSGVVVPWTEQLARAAFMIPCDINGAAVRKEDAQRDVSALSDREQLKRMTSVTDVVDFGLRFDIGVAKTLVESLKADQLKELVGAQFEMRDIRTKEAMVPFAAARDITIDGELVAWTLDGMKQAVVDAIINSFSSDAPEASEETEADAEAPPPAPPPAAKAKPKAKPKAKRKAPAKRKPKAKG